MEAMGNCGRHNSSKNQARSLKIGHWLPGLAVLNKKGTGTSKAHTISTGPLPHPFAVEKKAVAGVTHWK